MRENKEISERPAANKKVRALIIAVLAIILVCSGVFLALHFAGVLSAESDEKRLTTAPHSESDSQLAENPVDFESLQAGNSEIYAWITVPGTEVDHPVCQSRSDDEYYLRHRASDRQWSSAGAIFTQSMNALDFNDPVTVIYGHNGYAESMFTSLHQFEDETFFNEHEYFYIYTPDRKLTYQILSAFRYDDRHIMNSFNFSNPSELAAFQQTLADPQSMLVNVRGGITLDSDSKVVVLSTCFDNDDNSRYLVSGVLISDEKTE